MRVTRGTPLRSPLYGAHEEYAQVSDRTMTNWPDVTIGVITFNRPGDIVRTIDALEANIHYSGKLRWLIADDSTPDSDYLPFLKRTFKRLKPKVITTVTNGGWGVNANNLLANVTTDYLLQLEDDKELHTPLDLDVQIALMEVHADIGMVRIKGTAGDHVVMHQFEADISEWLPDFRHGYGSQGKLTYLQLDSGSPSLWLYSNGMHVKRRRFHEFYGLYPTGLNLGETETTYASIVKASMKQPDAPAIVVLPEWVVEQTEDFGQSFKGSEFDK